MFDGNGSTSGAVVMLFPEFLGPADLCFYNMETHKIACVRYNKKRYSYSLCDYSFLGGANAIFLFSSL